MYLIFGGKDLPERIDLGDLRGRGIKIQGRAKEYSKVGGYVGTHGDLNGDGRSDFVFTEDVMRPNIRSIYVVYGQGSDRRFVRGDANQDGRAEISDAVFTIGYLFLGGTPPACEDALDMDDLGTIELTDAIYLLSHLFLGGPAPPPPFPVAGFDPTADGLDCR